MQPREPSRWTVPVLLLTPIVTLGLMMCLAPDAAAQVSRVTDTLRDTASEVDKWKTYLQTIFTALVTGAACYVGYQWWAERGNGKESAKGLVVGVFFAFAVAPWLVDCAKGCGKVTGS